MTIEKARKAEIVAEIDRIGHEVLGFGQHAIFAFTSMRKIDLLIIRANFRLMEELKRRQQVIANRYEPKFWQQIKYSILRHDSDDTESLVSDLRRYWAIERELSRIWNQRWTVAGNRPADAQPSQRGGVMMNEIEAAVARCLATIDEADKLAVKAQKMHAEVETFLRLLAVETAARVGVRIGAVVTDDRGVRRVVDAIIGNIITDPRTGTDTLDVSVRLPRLTKAGTVSRKERYVWWAKLQQIADVPILPTLNPNLPKFTLESNNA